MVAKVIHVKDMWAYPDAVYVGRTNFAAHLKGSPLANPYKIGRGATRNDVIRSYSLHLAREVIGGNQKVLDALIAARGKPLACWCRADGEPVTEDNLCHADEIIRILSMFTDAELRRIGRFSGIAKTI